MSKTSQPRDKRFLDYTNKSERECFDLWLAECPVDYEASDCYDDWSEDGGTETEWYFFTIQKEDK
jgi:hypothetical protein